MPLVDIPELIADSVSNQVSGEEWIDADTDSREGLIREVLPGRGTEGGRALASARGLEEAIGI